ncbi:MAG TPA: N-acetylneuraminate synthase family protein [Kofleriaceae bacterium]|jgi:N-acetylneuraminate synthase
MSESLRQSIRFPEAPRRTGCIIIGEVAQSHDGSLGQAHAFIDAIAAAGADAVKFQTHIAHAESTPGEPWRVKFSHQDASRYDYWKRMEFTEAQWAGLKRHAEDKGLLFLSSAFSSEAVALLERLGIAAWKVASGEVSNLRLLEEMARTGKPMLLSSGMSRLDELDAAVGVARAAQLPFAVMQCTSMYPCPPDKIGLDLLAQYRSRFDCAVGLSDHSGTIFPGLAAATLGCDVLEIHVTFSKHMFGPDVPSSITVDQLAELVEGVRFIEAMRAGPTNKDELAAELAPLRALFTKSVVARTDLPAGTKLAFDHLAAKKPGTGIAASRMPELVGRRLVRAVAADALLSEADLEDAP